MQRFDITADTELQDVVKLFSSEPIGEIDEWFDDGRFYVTVGRRSFVFDYGDAIFSVIPQEHRVGRLKKIALYDALCAVFDSKMPWGALTGVRPTKLFYECLAQGYSPSDANRIMQELYRVSKKRADILSRIVEAQSGIVNFGNNSVNLYIHIPFCTSRCSYCSFVSAPVDKNKALVDSYVDYLCRDITRSVETARSLGLNILSVYIGGGTPTALDERNLQKVLSAVGDPHCEYTCEAGRPDTITHDKMRLLKDFGVTRVCVNPQTLCDRTLELIGRKHTSEDFFRAYDMARDIGFDINCDLIAGLPDETLTDFINSFDGIKRLEPQNITVHSLSKKNGSEMRYDTDDNSAAADMVDYALDHTGGYRPYYLYRQKRQVGNLENVGFSVCGKECVNNITTMEETVSVLACGAGAISKFIRNGVIERHANLRDVNLYITRFDEKLTDRLAAIKATLGN